MTRTQYLEALKALGLTPASKKTADALGLSVRQCQRIAAGKQPVSGTIHKLIIALIAIDHLNKEEKAK